MVRRLAGNGGVAATKQPGSHLLDGVLEFDQRLRHRLAPAEPIEHWLDRDLRHALVARPQALRLLVGGLLQPAQLQ